jgi:hypothetical protein
MVIDEQPSQTTFRDPMDPFLPFVTFAAPAVLWISACTFFKRAVLDARFNLLRDLVDAQNLVRLPAPGHVTVTALGRRVPVALLPMRPGMTFSRTDVLSHQLARVPMVVNSLKKRDFNGL